VIQTAPLPTNGLFSEQSFLCLCVHAQSAKDVQMKYNHVHFYLFGSSVIGNISGGSQTFGSRAFAWRTDEKEKQHFCGQRGFRGSNDAVQVQAT
jgi:hypothetical protein